VTSKGAFSSYKEPLRREPQGARLLPDNRSGLDVLAYRARSRPSSREARLRRRPLCGVRDLREIGPKEMVAFEPEEEGRGVRYKYGLDLRLALWWSALSQFRVHQFRRRRSPPDLGDPSHGQSGSIATMTALMSASA